MNQKIKGICFVLTAAFCFALMNTLVKLSGDLPFIQKSFFRNAVACVAATAVLLRSEEKFRFDKKNLMPLTLRAVLGTISVLGNFYAVDKMLLSDATMLNKLAPFFAIIFSFFILKEKIKIFQIAAIICAFAGSLLIIKPGFQVAAVMVPALIGLFGAMCNGCAYSIVRYLGSKGERGPFIVFYFSAFSCLVVLPFLLLDFHPMTVGQVVILLCAGIAAAVGQFAITAAYSCAPAKEISVYDYTQIVFSALFGFLFLQQIPDRYSVIGYIIICATSVVMFLINNTARARKM